MTLERMHRAFARGLMEYGMIRGTKRIEVAEAASGDEKVPAEASS